MQHLILGLKMFKLESIEHDYIRILKVRINRAWLYKDPKGLALQVSAQLG